MSGARGGHVTMTPLDLSLVATALPSALRQRLASLRKSTLLENPDVVYTTPKLPGEVSDASQHSIMRDVASEKQEQIRVIENELSRPSSSSSSDQSTSGSRTPEYGVATKDANVSGVAWNRVSPGSALLQNAAHEARQPQPDNELARSLFMNGFFYLLDALPGDLSPEETSIIRSKLPKGVEQTMPVCPQETRDHILSDSVQREPPRSLLRRALVTSIIRLFLIVHFLVPYVKLILQRLYRYERSYRVTERMLAISIDTIDNLGKRGDCVGSTVPQVGEGDIGKRIQDAVVWGLEETVRGVIEGVGEGLAILGAVSRENHDRVCAD